MALFANALRIILDTETDADSPDNEETYSQMRENLEVLLSLIGYTGDAGTLTSNPPNNTTGVATDAAGGFATNEHNGRRLFFITGHAKGNIYTIDDTTGTTLVCAGDNLYADGVRSGDKYRVFYNVERGLAHNHDGVNSPITQGVDRAYTPGNYQVAATEKSSSAVSYEKVDEWTLARAHGGFRFRFLLGCNISGPTAYARIYRNGVAVGVEHSSDSGNQVFTEDIGGWNHGDTIELWMYLLGANPANCTLKIGTSEIFENFAPVNITA